MEKTLYTIRKTENGYYWGYWKKNSSGYSRDINEAKLWTMEELKERFDVPSYTHNTSEYEDMLNKTHTKYTLEEYLEGK